MNKEMKELTQAELAELLSDPIISHQLKKIIDCLTAISAIRKKEGQDASLDSVWDFTVAKIDEQLAGLAGVEKEYFTKEEIDALSEIGFAQEVYRKAVNL